MREQSHYIPILKARLGEFTALRNMGGARSAQFTPLIEFMPTGDELDDETGEPIPEKVQLTAAKATNRLYENWNGSQDLIVDLHALPPIDDYFPVVNIIDEFYGRDGSKVIPVCRPMDSDNEKLIERLSESLGRFDKREICIRLSDEDLDERDEPMSTTLDRLLGQLSTEPGGVDLVIDFGAVSETSASFAARIARLVIVDLPHLNEWKSLTLAAGGFPIALDGVSPWRLTELPRWELTMWRNVRDRLQDKLRLPSFGDYAVAYPSQQAGLPFAPAPQIRYTASEAWLVVKGRKNDRRGSAQFFDICEVVAQHSEFTPELSWGDVQIAEKAQFAHMDPVPNGARSGNAMTWRAIGTSHHIAQVVHRLTTRGEP